MCLKYFKPQHCAGNQTINKMAEFQELPGFTIKRLSPPDTQHFAELIRVFKNVFEMDNSALPDHDYLQKQLANDDFLVFVSVTGNKAVGGLTAYVLWQYYTKLPLVYIYDLAVETSFQRRGIGRLLVSALIAHCKKTGAEEFYVQADAEDGHAIEFYRSTLAKETLAVHFSYSLKSSI